MHVTYTMLINTRVTVTQLRIHDTLFPLDKNDICFLMVPVHAHNL